VQVVSGFWCLCSIFVTILFIFQENIESELEVASESKVDVADLLDSVHHSVVITVILFTSYSFDNISVMWSSH